MSDVVYTPIIPFSPVVKEASQKVLNEFNPAPSYISKNPAAVSENSVAVGNHVLYTVPSGKITKLIGLAFSMSGTDSLADVLVSGARLLELGSSSVSAITTSNSVGITLNYENAIIISEGKQIVKRVFGVDAAQCCATAVYIEEDKP